MSSSASTPPSINIYAAAKAYEARQQAAKDHSQSPMSSSSSTYSSSPQTPSSADASKSAQKQKQKAVHMRRQSLLSMSPSFACRVVIVALPEAAFRLCRLPDLD